MLCPYCHKEAKWCENKEIYGRNYGKSYMCYWCKDCDAYVGCHNNTTREMGTMAKKELRELRHSCHKQFDKFWMRMRGSNKQRRNLAYDWLSSVMKIHPQLAHIGKFNEEQCKKLLEIIKVEFK